MSSLGPVLPGRIPGSLVAQRLLLSMKANKQTLTRLQDQLGSGQQYFLPSESPAAANRTILLQALQERKTQFSRNIETDRSFLNSTDGALASVSDALNRAKQLALAGIGDNATPGEKAALAQEAGSLVRQVVNIGNTTFRGRYLFAGSRAGSAPFELSQNGVLYSGDRLSLDSLIDLSTSLANNVDGHTALGGISSTASRDVNPALTLSTRFRDLHGGQGLTLGSIVVNLSSGSQTATIDLADAETISDLKARIENAFTPGSVTVSINAGQTGVQIAAAAGTVTVADQAGSLVAADLGIAGGPAASIVGIDLNPALTLTTNLSSLNGGTGIGATAGNGLQIVNGQTVSQVDLSTAVTVEDLFNLVRLADPNVTAGVNASGNGIEIASRLSGVNFSIGENNGSNATNLGIRTLVGTTALSSLNFGTGAPVSGLDTLNITRRDGTTANVNLSAALTVQDVIDTINAVDPGNLVASLVTVGNGLSLVDNSGTGPLTVEANALGTALGLAGSETGANPAVPLNGTDVNPHEVTGTLNLLVRLEAALSAGDNAELNRLGAQIDGEITRTTQVRGEVGGRLRSLDDAHSRLEDENIEIANSLSENFDADLATVLTQLLNQQAVFQAILQTSAESMRIGLINYL